MSNSTDRTYNGWTNYETWNVALWLGNEEHSSKYWDAVAQECWDDSEASGNFTHLEQAVSDLEDKLKDEVTASAPELGASMWSDLLGAALSEVNWREIASGLMESVDQTEEVEETEDEE